jgi:hypothetical protein
MTWSSVVRREGELARRIREVKCEDMNWIESPQVVVQRIGHLVTVMNLALP